MNKNYKLILSVFTILLVALTVGTAFSADGRMQSEKQFLSYLGITEGIDSPDDAQITRGEFACMVARMANLDTSMSSEGGFADVEGHRYQSEINTLKRYGITSGTSENTFTPDGKVSVAAAAKLLITAMDYDKIAEAQGGYPYGYLKIANSVDLFAGISVDDDILTVGESHVIIYNALLADKGVIEGISSGDIVYTTKSGRNLLTDNFGFQHKTGMVTSVGLVGVNEQKTAKGKVGIDYELFDTDIPMDEYFGLNVNVWYDEKGRKIGAVSVEEGSQVRLLDACDISDYENYVISCFDDNNITEKYKLDKGFTYVLNGKVAMFNKDSLMFEDGTIKLVDSNGDKDYDFVIAQKLDYFVISSIDSINCTIYDPKSPLGMLDLSDSDSTQYSIKLNGNLCDFEALKVGMTLSVSISDDKTVCNIYASSEVVETTLEEIAQDKLMLKGIEYKPNAYFKANNVSLRPGMDYTFLIAHDGTVTCALPAGQDGYKYGIFLDYNRGNGGFGNPAIKIMTETGEVCGFELSSKIRLNGVIVNNTDASIENLLMSGQYVRYQLVRYALKDDKLSKLDTENQTLTEWDFATEKSPDDSLTKYMNNTQVFYRSGQYSYGTPGVAFNGALIFRVPTTYDTIGESFSDDSFSVMTLGEITDQVEPYIDVYDFDDSMTPKVILYRENAVSTSVRYPGYRDRTYVVTSVSQGVDPEGDESVIIRAFADSEYEELYVKTEMYEQFEQKPTPGDCIRLTKDVAGYVIGLRVDVDYEFKDKQHHFTPHYGSYGVNNMAHAHITYYTGEAFVSQNDALTLRVINNPPAGYWVDTPGRILRLGASKPVYIEYNVTTGKARKITSSDIIGSKEAGDGNGSMVVCRTEYGCVQTAVVYTK